MSNPAAPQHLGVYRTAAVVWQVAVAGSLAYLADSNEGLVIVDVSKPSSPALVGKCPTDYAVGVQLVGERAYVADQYSGLKIIDVHDPASAAYVAQTKLAGLVLGVAVAEPLVYAADGDGGLCVLQMKPTQAVAVDFPDPNLEAAIRDTLHKPSGPITDLDMAGLEDLTARSRGIKSLVGLEYAKNLSSLDLYNNQISDISPLAWLVKLSILDLSYQALDASDGIHPIRDLGPLASLTNLTKLFLDRNEISDLTPLEGLTNLQSLGLADQRFQAWEGTHPIRDIAPLARLTNLTYLAVSGNQISDISPLAGLTKLTTLELGRRDWGSTINGKSNQISDITALSGMKDLTHLDLSQNLVEDLQPLASLTSLAELYLSGNSIGDLGALSGLRKLQMLLLDGNVVSDISAVERLTELAHVDLTSNMVEDLQPLKNLANLTELNLSANLISDITSLAGLKALEHLELGNYWASSGRGGSNSISDVSDLSDLTNLTYLDLSGNLVEDLQPLSSLKSLTELYLSENWISDTSPLAGLKNLDTLSLDENSISQITGLEALTALTWLNLSYNHLDVSDGSVARKVIDALEANGAHVSYDDQGPGLLISNDSSSPDNLAADLGTFLFGQGSPKSVFTLQNDYGFALSISGFTIGGADLPEFKITLKDPAGTPVYASGFQIGPHAAWTVEVELRPTSPGAKAATIAFSTTDPLLSAITIMMAGEAVTQGPVMVKTVGSGPLPSYPHDFVNVNGALFFAANDYVHGHELWRTDGTAEGTFVLRIDESTTVG